MFNPFSALTSKIFAGVAIFALTLAAIQTIRLEGFFFFDGVIEKLEKERAAHITTKVGYANAQLAAAELNRHQVAAIKERYDAIATETENEYEKRLADNRAALRQWMRTKAAPSIAQSTGTGSPATMPGEPVQDAEKTEFLVSAEDLEIAADNYSQLTALIDWAKKVGEVKP